MYIFFIILEIKESFHKIDLNGDGRLSRRELMKAAAVLGMNPTDKDIDAMMKDVDKNSTWKLQLFSMGLGLWLKCYVKPAHCGGEPFIIYFWFWTNCQSDWLENIPNKLTMTSQTFSQHKHRTAFLCSLSFGIDLSIFIIKQRFYSFSCFSKISLCA